MWQKLTNQCLIYFEVTDFVNFPYKQTYWILKQESIDQKWFSNDLAVFFGLISKDGSKLSQVNTYKLARVCEKDQYKKKKLAASSSTSFHCIFIHISKRSIRFIFSASLKTLPFLLMNRDNTGFKLFG